jgi:membrane protein implicated in regulation of membrane protease activity
MLGREPRLPHRTLRWLIVALMLLNGVQLVLLQLAINSSALYDVGQTWTYVVISLVAVVISTALLGVAFLRGRGKGSSIKVQRPSEGGRGTVSSDKLRGDK